MIARLRGTVLSIKTPNVVIDVNGVGYRVMCSQSALDICDLGRNADLHTHMQVREDDISLFGFAGEDEMALFLQLLSVQGVGARTAIAALSKLSPEALREAITNNQVDTLSRVPGIGKKTAEKIVFSLRGKLGGLDALPGEFAAPMSATDAEVVSALTSLGYSIAEAQTALASIPRDEAKTLDLEEKIRRSLSYFG